jgi:glycine betaine transporter
MSFQILKPVLKSTNAVFGISCALVLVFLVWGALAPDDLAKRTSAFQTSLLDSFGWLYVLAASAFLLCAFCLIFSRWGDIPLGPDGCKPEFPLLTWFAMLFCAGMGIGLVFWGVAEPTSHFMSPLPGREGLRKPLAWPCNIRFFIGVCTHGVFTRW